MTWEEITKELFEEKTTKRFQIIHLGNPYDFVVKDHNTNKTYGTLQGDDKSLMELLNELDSENQRLKLENDGLRYALKNIKQIDVEIDIGD